jgi:phosphoglycolate phosphatase-like HAD superfamily hydrolase
LPPISPTFAAISGLSGALDVLASRGSRFAVCTNKLEGLSRLLLDTLGLSARFEAICGQDTFGVHKRQIPRYCGAQSSRPG